jgi:hypothetical protein
MLTFIYLFIYFDMSIQEKRKEGFKFVTFALLDVVYKLRPLEDHANFY